MSRMLQALKAIEARESREEAEPLHVSHFDRPIMAAVPAPNAGYGIVEEDRQPYIQQPQENSEAHPDRGELAEPPGIEAKVATPLSPLPSGESGVRGQELSEVALPSLFEDATESVLPAADAETASSHDAYEIPTADPVENSITEKSPAPNQSAQDIDETEHVPPPFPSQRPAAALPRPPQPGIARRLGKTPEHDLAASLLSHLETPTSLMISSADESVMRSQSSLWLAEQLATESDHAVLLISANDGRVSARADIQPGTSLNDLLSSEDNWKEAILQSPVAGLCLLPLTDTNHDIDAARLCRWIEQLKEHFPIIVAPAFSIQELTAACDTAVLFIRPGYTTRAAARQEASRLQKQGLDLIGAILVQ